jgi:hypothetical protein
LIAPQAASATDDEQLSMSMFASFEELNAAKAARAAQVTPEGADLPQNGNLPRPYTYWMERALDAEKKLAASQQMPDWMRADDDTLLIHGVRYDQRLFEHLGKALPVGDAFVVEAREADGAITLCKLDKSVWQGAAAEPAAIQKAALLEQAKTFETLFASTDVLDVAYVADSLRVAAGEKPRNERLDRAAPPQQVDTNGLPG